MEPDSPLGQAVKDLLERHPDGLHKAELLRQLRRSNPFVLEQHLDEILAHPDLFAERPGQIWVLTQLLEVCQPDEAPLIIDEPPSYQRDPLDELPPVPLPVDLSTYVVFDFETSGFDAHSESIIQFAAVRVESNQIVEGCNLFVRPAKPLPLSLQQKLNLADDPVKLDAINQAPPIDEQIHKIIAFLGSWPLVAHNGRFDYRFLRVATESHLQTKPGNALVDTMELALLVEPGLEAYRLEDLAHHWQIDRKVAASGVPDSVQESMGIDLDNDAFHDAAVDVLFLYHVFGALRNELQALPDAVQSEMLRLLPREEHALSSLLDTKVLPTADPVPLVDLFLENRSTEGQVGEEALRFSPAAIEDMFGAAGALAQQAKAAGIEFRQRPRQQEMVAHVCQALADETSAMIEAPTGTGKTLEVDS